MIFQIALVLIGKILVLEGSTTEIENKQVPGVYIYIVYIFILRCSQGWPAPNIFGLIFQLLIQDDLMPFCLVPDPF